MSWYLIMVLIWISLMASDAEYIFIHLLAVCISLAENCLFRSCDHYFIGFTCLLFCCCWGFLIALYILDINLCQLNNLQIFSPILLDISWLLCFFFLFLYRSFRDWYSSICLVLLLLPALLKPYPKYIAYTNDLKCFLYIFF